jgi:hypothetical protein
VLIIGQPWQLPAQRRRSKLATCCQFIPGYARPLPALTVIPQALAETADAKVPEEEVSIGDDGLPGRLRFARCFIAALGFGTDMSPFWVTMSVNLPFRASSWAE